MHGKMSFPSLGCNCITRLYNKVLLLLWILANDCFLDQKYFFVSFQAVERYFINMYLYPTHYSFFVQYLINQSMKKTKTEEKKANIHLVSIQNLVSEQLFVRTQ